MSANLSFFEKPVFRSGVILTIILAFAAPTLLRIAQQSWTQESGAHGPIVLATGLWLMTQCDWTDGTDNPRIFQKYAPWALLIFVALPTYIFGRAYDFLSLEAGGVYLAIVAIAAVWLGFGTLLRNFFPIFYLGFLLPLPGWVIDTATAPLQQLISESATRLLQAVGYPVSNSGVSITISHYQLLVEQACSGMNSIIGLVSITLFYIYILHKASWKYALVLIALILPVAMLANFVRVLVLILLTYYFGDAIAQGFLHGSAGILLFGAALLMMIAIDAGLRRLAPRLSS